MIDRRAFLKRLGLGAAAVAGALVLPPGARELIKEPTKKYFFGPWPRIKEGRLTASWHLTSKPLTEEYFGLPHANGDYFSPNLDTDVSRHWKVTRENGLVDLPSWDVSKEAMDRIAQALKDEIDRKATEEIVKVWNCPTATLGDLVETAYNHNMRLHVEGRVKGRTETPPGGTHVHSAAFNGRLVLDLEPILATS